MQQEIDTYISEGEAVYNVQLSVSLSLIFIPVFSFHVHIVMLHIVFLHATCRYKCSPLVELNLCLKSIKNSTSWKVKCSVVKARNGQPVFKGYCQVEKSRIYRCQYRIKNNNSSENMMSITYGLIRQVKWLFWPSG